MQESFIQQVVSLGVGKTLVGDPSVILLKLSDAYHFLGHPHALPIVDSPDEVPLWEHIYLVNTVRLANLPCFGDKDAFLVVIALLSERHGLVSKQMPLTQRALWKMLRKDFAQKHSLRYTFLVEFANACIEKISPTYLSPLAAHVENKGAPGGGSDSDFNETQTAHAIMLLFAAYAHAHTTIGKVPSDWVEDATRHPYLHATLELLDVPVLRAINRHIALMALLSTGHTYLSSKLDVVDRTLWIEARNNFALKFPDQNRALAGFANDQMVQMSPQK